MAKEIATIKQEAQVVRYQKTVGGNTAERVGKVLEDITDYIGEHLTTGTLELADGSVTTPKIADEAVTEEKISDDAYIPLWDIEEMADDIFGEIGKEELIAKK